MSATASGTPSGFTLLSSLVSRIDEQAKIEDRPRIPAARRAQWYRAIEATPITIDL
jgi:hypothetical protein